MPAQFDMIPDESRRAAGKIAETVENRCAARSVLPTTIAAKGAHRPGPAPSTSPRCGGRQQPVEPRTVIEVSGLDRPGLLAELTNAISKLNLNIGSAHIATFGEKAVDVFYVTDLTGAKVTNQAR